MEAVQRASDTVFTEFDTKRAENAKYPDEVFFERQAFIGMRGDATTTPRWEFACASDYDEVPHGRTHLRTIKKTATPDPQTQLDAFREQEREPDWKRVRDEVLEPFHRGMEKVLEDARTRKDSAGVREPVIAAIDVTEWPFYASPIRPHGEKEPEDHQIRRNGKRRYVRHEYPDTVSGTYRDYDRAFKFAIISIIAGDTPFILGAEPVREKSWWEPDDVDGLRRADVVSRLLEQASQHVDIQKVFMDAWFDSGGVKNDVDERGITYLIPKRQRNSDDRWAIKTVEEKPTVEGASARDVEVEDKATGRSHTGSVLYEPSNRSDGYAVFVTNRDVPAEGAPGFVNQYQQRWEIENQYKAIKANFLPQCGSSDYRIRFLYFVLGCMMHNVWRLSNYYLCEVIAPEAEFSRDLPIPASQIVLIIGFAIDPGG